jgi:tetratricopeptide (TPR) repeat protein
MSCPSPHSPGPAGLLGSSSRPTAAPRLSRSIVRLSLGAFLAALPFFPVVLAPGPSVALAADADRLGRPPDILSWRHQVLEPEEYEKLAAQWEAFVAAHPNDARALVEWGDALRYSGKREEAGAKFQKAFQVDSLDAAAVEAYVASNQSLHGTEAAWRVAHLRLVRALERDPNFPPTLYVLWFSSLRAGDQALANRCLRGMAESGDMPRPLLEYGSNMVEGAPPNAIILTNGDNDTYPPLSYQVLTGRRPDVAIVNLSLLNTVWYIQYQKSSGLPITFTEKETEALKPKSKDRIIADEVVEHLAGNLAKSGGRPLLYAVSVPDDRRQLATGPCLGLLVPVTGGPIAADAKKSEPGDDATCDWARTRELLDTVYRTEAVIDPLVDWKRESAVARMVPNYVALESGVAAWLVSGGSKDEAGGYYLRAIRQLAFHGKREYAQQILDDWAKAAPESTLLPEARKLLAK